MRFGDLPVEPSDRSPIIASQLVARMRVRRRASRSNPVGLRGGPQNEFSHRVGKALGLIAVGHHGGLRLDLDLVAGIARGNREPAVAEITTAIRCQFLICSDEVIDATASATYTKSH
jgi:hypothetical protein